LKKEARLIALVREFAAREDLTLRPGFNPSDWDGVAAFWKGAEQGQILMAQRILAILESE